ncbi:MAG: helix-turn-helix transcriptional regulator [Agathobacter sp.]|nr:helix-turn-helix transcriptional regulator [Agathobacter sp.]
MNYKTSFENFNLDYASFDKAKLLYASTSRYSGEWHSNPHTHYCSEIFYITEGNGQFQIKDQIYPIHPHDLIIINPNVEHTELSHSENPLSYIVIGIENVELTSLEEDDYVPFCVISLKRIKDIVNFYFNQILAEVNKKAPDSEIMCRNLTQNLVILLSRQANFTVTLTPLEKKSPRVCIAIRQYIDHHFKENITLDTLSSITHVSKYHLVHVFSQEYGVSPINYLIYKRIEEGKKLLQTTDYSLALIGRTLGFSSPSYFSQAFKKQTSYTPMEYRKLSRTLS